MGKTEMQKLKILYILDYLRENSDAGHPVTAAELISHLEANGIAAERKSVYSDILCLQTYGYDIEQKKGRSGGYYLACRDFELPELKLLVDAVQSSKFLTSKKSLELIGKLEKLAGRHDAQDLQRNIFVTGRVKNMNESIYYNIDAIQDAITQNAQITFRYFEWGTDRERHFREGAYEASPYALIWDDEYYYLVAYTEKHGITHYRVDKMTSIRALGKQREMQLYKTLDLSTYGKNIFSMYSGEKQQVKMRFENALANVVIDRFGRSSILIPDGADHFTLTTEIYVSPVFFGWFSQFGARACILYPEDVRKRFKKILSETVKLYK